MLFIEVLFSSLDKASFGEVGGVEIMSPVAVFSEEVSGLGNPACTGLQPS
jgi:hypothetical protein